MQFQHCYGVFCRGGILISFKITQLLSSLNFNSITQWCIRLSIFIQCLAYSTDMSKGGTLQLTPLPICTVCLHKALPSQAAPITIYFRIGDGENYATPRQRSGCHLLQKQSKAEEGFLIFNTFKLISVRPVPLWSEHILFSISFWPSKCDKWHN